MTQGGKPARNPGAVRTTPAGTARYDAVLFDADDTLLDYPTAERDALLAACASAGLTGDPALLTAVYRRHNHEAWRAYERGELSQTRLRTIRFERMLHELGRDTQAAARLSDLYLEVLATRAPVYDGADELIDDLAPHFRLGIITNGIARVQRGRFARSRFANAMRTIIISEEVGVAKPDPAIFLPALTALQVTRERTLYIGDSVTSDMPAAHAAGIDFCWYNPHGMPVPDGYAPVAVVRDFHSIRTFLGVE